MKAEKSERAFTRHLILSALVAIVLLSGWMVVFAQGFRIIGVRNAGSGRLNIEYVGDKSNQFRLLQGNSVTNIKTPVATNSAGLGLRQFNQAFPDSQPGTASAGFFRIERMSSETAAVPLSTIVSSPVNGERDVSVNRETTLYFSEPIASDATITTSNFYASSGDRKLLSRVELSSDRRTVSLFYLEPLPSSTRVVVVLDGSKIHDYLGRLVDADGDGQPGGTLSTAFDTIGNVANNGTAVVGRVFASELLPDPDNVMNTINRPLSGVTITVDGAEETLRVITDAQGNFRLQPAPSGNFFVHIDGRTSPLSKYPNGDYYPVVGKKWSAAPGRLDNLAGETGEIYLPLIAAGTLKPVSTTNDTTITFNTSVIANNPALAGVSITIPANALFNDNGTRGGKVGITPVSPDRLPGPLPSGLQFPLVITVQTDGALNLDRPAPVCFPNLPDPGTGEPLRPGEKNYLYSFNHKKGEWEAIGAMTVSQDGRFICSDPGVGIVQPGWHGSGPPPSGPPPPPPWRGYCCPGGGAPSGNLATCNKRCQRNFALCLVGCGVPSLGCGPFVPLCGFTCGFVCTLAYGFCVNDCNEDNCSGQSSSLALRSAVGLAGQIPAIDPLGDPRIEQIAGLAGEIRDILYPYGLKNEAIPAVVRSQVEKLSTDADRLAGGNAVEFMKARAAAAEEIILANGDLDGDAPDYPINFVAEIETTGGSSVIRGKTGPRGYYQLFLTRSSRILSVRFFDPLANKVGIVFPYYGSSSRFKVPRVTMISIPEAWPDQDSDGLQDFAEQVLGTSPLVFDTDDDGIADGVEVAQGTNPLDGRPVATGIISTAPTPGTAVDICSINNTVIVAELDAGISVFNVLDGLNPIRVAQINGLGSAQAVACSGDLVLVAGGGQGASIVDVAEPGRARVAGQLLPPSLGGGSIHAVATASDLGFAAGTAGVVNMIDLNTATVLQRIDLGGRVEDLAIQGLTLFAYANGRLYTIPFGLGAMQIAGSIDCPTPAGVNTANGRGRLFVGGDIAYAVHTKGYNTFDVSGIGAPRLINAGNSAQFGWKQIVLNGSGLGVAAMSPNQAFDGPHNVALYNTSNPDSDIESSFITLFETPGIARAVSIYNGLAYVADHNNGMHVLNYLPYDNHGRAPLGRLLTSATDGKVSSGGFVVLRAEVTDDVQVRSVEFYLQGVRLVTDGNYPFETVYRVPANQVGANLNFSARIFDTGGNSTNAILNPIRIVPDATPPFVSIENPKDGDRFNLAESVLTKVTAIDNTGIAELLFRFDGFVATAKRLSLNEFDVTAPLATGPHVLDVIATDFSGLSSTSSPVNIVIQVETISREVSIFGRTSSSIDDSVSREVSIFGKQASTFADAISREVSTFGNVPTEAQDAISREVSIFGRNPVTENDAISREVSVKPIQ